MTGDLPIMSVQARLRQLVWDAGIEVPLSRLPQVKVVALGGLSESGKSTTPQYLRVRSDPMPGAATPPGGPDPHAGS